MDLFDAGKLLLLFARGPLPISEDCEFPTRGSFVDEFLPDSSNNGVEPHINEERVEAIGDPTTWAIETGFFIFPKGLKCPTELLLVEKAIWPTAV